MPEQLSFHDRRDLGINRSREGAHRQHGDEWTESAATYLKLFAIGTAKGQPFVLEDARETADRKVKKPRNGKAWGAAAQYAQRQGWIVKVGYAPTRSSNGSPKCLWRAA